MTRVFEHKDKLENPLTLGDFVAYPAGNHLNFGRVVKLNAKMVKVEEIVATSSKWAAPTHNKYPRDIVRLEQTAMLFYMLKLQ